MDLQADLVAPCPPDVLFAQVSDLSRYPDWLEIVVQANPVEPEVWEVDLRGRIGRLARTKRLRMIRTRHEPPNHVVFDRAETDTRDHSDWRLAVDVEPTDDGCALVMHLTYDGGLFEPVLERYLRDEIEASRPRLLALVTPTPD